MSRGGGGGGGRKITRREKKGKRRRSSKIPSPLLLHFLLLPPPPPRRGHPSFRAGGIRGQGAFRIYLPTKGQSPRAYVWSVQTFRPSSVRSFGGGGAGGSDIVVRRRRRKKRRGRLRRSGRMVRVFLTTFPPPPRYLPRPGEHTHSRKKVGFFPAEKKVFSPPPSPLSSLLYAFLTNSRGEEGGKPESLYFLMRRTSFSPINFFQSTIFGTFYRRREFAASPSFPHGCLSY